MGKWENRRGTSSLAHRTLPSGVCNSCSVGTELTDNVGVDIGLRATIEGRGGAEVRDEVGVGVAVKVVTVAAGEGCIPILGVGEGTIAPGSPDDTAGVAVAIVGGLEVVPESLQAERNSPRNNVGVAIVGCAT